MRIFLAVGIPESIKKKLMEVQKNLEPQLPGVRWERAEKLHITLVFLGAVEEERVPELEETVRKGLEGIKGVKVGLSGVGAFPKGKRPRVVLVGVGEGIERLVQLQERLAQALSEGGFTFSRLSRPHVTVGRFGRGSSIHPTLRVEEVEGAGGGEFRAREVVIMESRLRPTGSVHTPLSRIPLTKNKNYEH